jgi:hypothetical protein
MAEEARKVIRKKAVLDATGWSNSCPNEIVVGQPRKAAEPKAETLAVVLAKQGDTA